MRHEQAAVHAAEGYARSTGRVGCVLVTSGPGATNAVTGIADAMLDPIPLAVLTGQVPTHLIGNDAFQEADTTGITRPVTKHNYLVTDVDQMAATIHDAFYVARLAALALLLLICPRIRSRPKPAFMKNHGPAPSHLSPKLDPRQRPLPRRWP